MTKDLGEGLEIRKLEEVENDLGWDEWIVINSCSGMDIVLGKITRNDKGEALFDPMRDQWLSPPEMIRITLKLFELRENG